jgi:hypothetical protein
MWESASPNPVTLLVLDSVSETFHFHGAGSTQSFRGFDCNLPRVRVGVVLGPENLGDFFTRHTTGLIDCVTEFSVGVFLSLVSHRLIVEEVHGG